MSTEPALKVNSMKDLFRKARPWGYEIGQPIPNRLTVNAARHVDRWGHTLYSDKTTERRKLSAHCRVTASRSLGRSFESLEVFPTDLVLDFVADRMISTAASGVINFEIHVRDDHTIAVYADYNDIIGSRCLAAFTSAQTAEFFKLAGYRSL